MFLTIPMLFSCMFSYPFSSTPNSYRTFDDYSQYGMMAQIEPVNISFTNGGDRVLISYFDADTGTRNDLFAISINAYNVEQEYVISIDVYQNINYYGLFTVYEPGTDIQDYEFGNTYVDFYNPAIVGDNAYTFSIAYSDVPNDRILDLSYAFQLNYLDRGQFDTLSGASSTSYQDGYNQGVEDGKKIGIDIGYQDGYAQGREDFEDTDAQINSIFEGILSVGLLPIEFFLSIFNFEIFGINVTSIVSAILSLCVIIILLRYVLGGKSS